MKKILANTVYSDATLRSWRKEDLIEQIRILEHNWAAAEEALNNSAKNSDKIFAKQKEEIERYKCVNKLLEKDIGDLHKERERRVEEVYADFMKDYKIMRDELNELYDENSKLQQQNEELQRKVDKYGV